MEFSEEEARALNSLVMTESHRLSNGTITAEARAQALQNVADTFCPGMTGEELQRSLFAVFSKLIPKRAVLTKKVEETPAEVMPNKPTFESLYRAWIDNNDVIPPDSLLIHFGIGTRGAASRIRSVMRDEGYDIVLIGENKGFTVADRPEKKTKSIEETLTELAQALKDKANVRATALFMELLEATKKDEK